jgi:hypothetical protein
MLFIICYKYVKQKLYKLKNKIMETKFRITYDDNQHDVLDKISSKLKEFGLTIKQLEGGDGWVEYEIVKI